MDFATPMWIARRFAAAASLTASVTAIGIFLPVSSAKAKDLGVLTRVLQAAFLADQGSAVCASSRLDFSAEDNAAFRSAKSYAQFIKGKVSDGLSTEDVTKVLTDAANAAKSEAQQAFAALRGDPDVARWCTQTVAPFARQVVGTYERNTAEIDGIISKAKRD